MLQNSTSKFQKTVWMIKQRRVRVALEAALVAALGALSGLAVNRVPSIHRAIHKVRLHHGTTPNLLGSRFVIPGAPKSYLLLYTSPSCRFSVASMPFHRKVLRIAQAAGIPVYVAVRQSADVAQYQHAGEFSDARFVLGDSLSVEPAGTPAILFVHDAVVRQVWNGVQQTEWQQSEVLNTIAQSH